MSHSGIRFDNVSKAYGNLRVVEGLDLDIAGGEFVSLLGPSGSGKTTLLMMLAGFEDVTSGRILVDGALVNDIPTYRRDMGVVFQNYALFPHLDIARNVAFPLEMRGMGRADIRQRVDRALEMVQLLHLRDRRPSQLSGGQQQRVALARALVFEPRVVLMDEPLGALDKQLREQMQLDIRAIHRRLGVTIVFVTHDQQEALTMSDRIAVFDKGRIQQIGTPREVYDRPANRFVAEFIGETNLLAGTVETAENGGTAVSLSDGTRIEGRSPAGLARGSAALASIRPERARLHAERPAEGNALPAQVTDILYQGSHIRVDLKGVDGQLTVHLDRSAGEPAVGAPVWLGFAPDDCWIISP